MTIIYHSDYTQTQLTEEVMQTNTFAMKEINIDEAKVDHFCLKTYWGVNHLVRMEM